MAMANTRITDDELKKNLEFKIFFKIFFFRIYRLCLGSLEASIKQKFLW